MARPSLTSYDWVSEDVAKVVLIYTTSEDVRAMNKLSRTANGEGVFVCRTCRSEDRVYIELSWGLDAKFIFMYETFFSCLEVELPLTKF